MYKIIYKIFKKYIVHGVGKKRPFYLFSYVYEQRRGYA